MLARPRGSAEWHWAAGGALLLVAARLVPLRDALAAVARGGDVYLFLAGMMVLGELARREGVFEWLAALAAGAAGGSRFRLLALVYGAGALVTGVLSNDATAVVLTPAVAAVARRARAAPLPYLYACAFVANAASFVLPISNPANLVVFGGAMPHLGTWLAAFALPSAGALGVTFATLALAKRRDLAGPLASPPAVPALTGGGHAALSGIAGAALVLLAASAAGAPLGLVTCAAGTCAFAAVAAFDRAGALAVPRRVPWSILVLVAGLFVMVAGLDRTGLLVAARSLAASVAAWPRFPAIIVTGFAAALGANIANNLPAALVTGTALSHAGGAPLREAGAIGIDLGPNASITASLATVLWAIAVRRENVAVSPAAFLRLGLCVTVPALALALAALAVTAR
jgi:arsenical pump membrane protein